MCMFVLVYLGEVLHMYLSMVSFPCLNALSSFVPELDGYLNSLEWLEVTFTGVLFHRNGEPDRQGGFLMCAF